jgi:hypothetical protein
LNNNGNKKNAAWSLYLSFNSSSFCYWAFIIFDSTSFFFAVLEIENEFGLGLSTLMGAVLVISSLWLVSGIKQYLSMGRWSKRYNEYIKAKEEIDKKIAIGYGLGTVSTPDQ